MDTQKSATVLALRISPSATDSQILKDEIVAQGKGFRVEGVFDCQR